MNLSSLKPAWRRYKLLCSMQPVGQQDILLMIERAEDVALGKTNRPLVITVLFIVLTLCCQGG